MSYELHVHVLSIMKIALILAALVLISEAVNIKKIYCGKQEYVGNPGNKYPHLHCGSNFLTLSREKNRHINLIEKCNTINEILKDKLNYYGKAANPKSITTALKLYFEDVCRNENSPRKELWWYMHMTCTFRSHVSIEKPACLGASKTTVQA